MDNIKLYYEGKLARKLHRKRNRDKQNTNPLVTTSEEIPRIEITDETQSQVNIQRNFHCLIKKTKEKETMSLKSISESDDSMSSGIDRSITPFASINKKVSTNLHENCGRYLGK